MAKTEEQKEFDINNQVDTHKNLIGKDKKLVKVDSQDEIMLKSAKDAIGRATEQLPESGFDGLQKEFNNAARWLEDVSKNAERKIKELNKDTAYRTISDNKDTSKILAKMTSISTWLKDLSEKYSLDDSVNVGTAEKTVKEFNKLSNGLKEKAALFNYKLLLIPLGEELSKFVESLKAALENAKNKENTSEEGK